MKYNVRNNPFLKFHEMRRMKNHLGKYDVLLLNLPHSSISKYLRRIE